MSEEINTTQQATTEPAAGAAGGSEPAPADPAKTFTQEDVNKIVTRESRSAVEKLLNEAGIAPEGDFKTSLKAFKEWQDGQKTELEKVSGSLTAEQAARAAAEAKLVQMERSMIARDKDIPADKADKYIGLAEMYMNDDVDFAAALELALQDFPVNAASGVPGSAANPAGALSSTPGSARGHESMNALIRGAR